MAESPAGRSDNEQVDAEVQARREFLKRIGVASAVLPAVTVLLAADFKTAGAQTPMGGGCGCGCGCGDPY
jgi:hypothetical protein